MSTWCQFHTSERVGPLASWLCKWTRKIPTKFPSERLLLLASSRASLPQWERMTTNQFLRRSTRGTLRKWLIFSEKFPILKIYLRTSLLKLCYCFKSENTVSAMLFAGRVIHLTMYSLWRTANTKLHNAKLNHQATTAWSQRSKPGRF